MRKRPLYETLAEIADDLLTMTAETSLAVSSVELRLPLDIQLRSSDGELTGGLPEFRMRTMFDPEPTWLHMVLGEICYDE